MTTPARRALRGLPVLVGLVGLLIASALVVRNLVVTDWNPTTFVAFGEDAPKTLAYGEARLTDIDVRSGFGHDGKFFFVQANDPWVLHPADNAEILDRPLYRSQRMLYPLLAGGFGIFPPTVIVWSMIVVNVLALGFGTWATALLAREMGGSPWWGLAFALNVGLLSEMLVGGAGAVSGALVIFAALAVHRRWHIGGVLAVTGAALTREATLICAVGLAWWVWRNESRRVALAYLLVPVLAVGSWGVYLRTRLGWTSTGQVQEIGLPFVGFFRSFPLWRAEPVDLVAGLAIMFLLLLFVRRMFMSDWPVGWATIGFVPLALLFTRQVWFQYFDITRAVAPMITAFILVAFAARTQEPSPERVRQAAAP